MKTLVTVIILLISGEVFAASFNCSLAKTKIEKLICSNPDVSNKDGELANIYNEVNRKSADNGFLIDKQIQWLKERNCCASKECVLNKYNERIQVISH